LKPIQLERSSPTRLTRELLTMFRASSADS
jgi:hypothetical protein